MQILLPPAMITDRKTIIIEGEDGGYSELGNKKGSGLVMDSKSFPKRRKVSAVRHFPDSLKQCHGEKGLEEIAIISSDKSGDSKFNNGIEPTDTDSMSLRNSDDLKGTSNVGEQPEITDTDLMTLRNNAEAMADNVLNHDGLCLTGLEMEYATGEEKVLKSVTDFLDSWETVASVTTPSTIIDASDYAAKESKFKDDRRTDEDAYTELEFSKSVRQDRMRVRVCSPLNHKNTSIKTRKVSAVRDFPVAFELIEMKGSVCDLPLEKEPVIPNPKVSLEQEEEEGKRNQGQHLASKGPKRLEIVLALMAPSRCPCSLYRNPEVLFLN